MIIAILAIYFLIVGQFRSFAVAWVVMLPFLLWFFGIFPWFSILYLLKNEYFNATAMIWIISLAWIVVWNAILLIDYVNILKSRWWTIEKAIIEAWYIRFMPIMLTSMAAIFGAIKITSDPVWSGLARSIVWWLATSAILTLIAIPIFYYDSQKKSWDEDMMKDKII
jgi:multidrug efflux pump subunit AcrB